MGGASWAPIRICSSSTSTTNSPNKNPGKPPTRSRRERGSWALGRSLEGARTQADFVVNIMLLIGRIVKRNLRLLAAFLWNSGCTLQGLRPSGGVLPAGAGGSPAGSGIGRHFVETPEVCLVGLQATYAMLSCECRSSCCAFFRAGDSSQVSCFGPLGSIPFQLVPQLALNYSFPGFRSAGFGGYGSYREQQSPADRG